MNPFLVFLVIICSSIAIKPNYNIYEKLCPSSIFRPKTEEVAKLVKDRRSGVLDHDCDHSIGFYFNTKLCQSFESQPRYNPYNAKNFSAFLSDEDQYLYIHLSSNLRPPKQSYKTIEVNDKIELGYFESFSPQNALFVLWIKEKIIDDLSYSYQIDYTYSELSNKLTHKSITTEKLLARTDLQLALTHIKIRNNVKLNISFASNPSENIHIWDRITIRDSYFIICGRKLRANYYSFRNCKPFEEKESIRCQCTTSSQSSDIILIVLVIFWSSFIISILLPVLELLNGSNIRAKTFYVLHNCNENNFKYQYLVGVRLSVASSDFELENVTIDVEFFTRNNQSIAPNYRFKADILKDRAVTEILFIMWFLTKMPELKQIKCSHSGKPEGKICLIGVRTRCASAETESDLESTDNCYKVSKSFTRTPRIFNLRKGKPEDEAPDAEEKPLRDITLNKISLSKLEVIFIMFVDILFMALVSILIPMDFIENIFFQMLLSVVFNTFCGIAFHTLFVLIYKFLLLIEMRQEIKMRSQTEKISSIALTIFVGASLSAALIFSYLIYDYRETDSLMVIYRWIAVIVCSSALLAMVWELSHFIHLEDKFFSKKRESESSLTVNSASINDPVF